MKRSPDSFFPIPSVSEMPEDLGELCKTLEDDLGFVPNVFTAWAHRPERLRTFFQYYALTMEGTDHLSETDREMIAVVVSSINKCTYCLVAHGHSLRRGLGDAEKADRIAFNWRLADLDDREAAICHYAEKLTVRPAEMCEEDLDALRAVGLSEDEVWDVGEVASVYNLTNRAMLAWGILPNAEYYNLDRELKTSPGVERS